MKTLASITVDRYLRSSWNPDREYVDGELLERNLGEKDHSELQRELIFFFRSRRQQWKVFVFPEQRIQISPTRFRIPDVCVYTEKPHEQVFRTPPFICIEILSLEDRMERLQERIDDYLKFGVPYVWVINPRNRRAWVYTTHGSREADEVLRTENPSFEIPLAELFAGIDA